MCPPKGADGGKETERSDTQAGVLKVPYKVGRKQCLAQI
jgi:hypothetical protein